jgi:dienelactone hydrolase
MTWDSYENIWTTLVNNGYVVAFPRTEGSFSPSHNDFGLDLAQVSEQMLNLNTVVSSIFYQGLNEKVAIMGHSMGGGSTFLAANNTNSVQTVIGLAPAETDPSAIAAASLVSIPSLILSGSSDGVTPEVDHHLPIYNALISTCKYFVSILGGAHCFFANANFNCDTGEAFSSTGISITREEQQQTASDYYLPWLNVYLKNNCQDIDIINAYAVSDNRTVVSSVCQFECDSTSSITIADESLISICPNPTSDFIYIEGNFKQGDQIIILNSIGQIIISKEAQNGKIDLRALPNGVYFVRMNNLNLKIVKE